MVLVVDLDTVVVVELEVIELRDMVQALYKEQLYLHQQVFTLLQ